MTFLSSSTLATTQIMGVQGNQLDEFRNSSILVGVQHFLTKGADLVVLEAGHSAARIVTNSDVM